MPYGTPAPVERPATYTLNGSMINEGGDVGVGVVMTHSTEYSFDPDDMDAVFQALVDALAAHPLIASVNAAKAYSTTEEITVT